jgi:hypothetical protein
MSAVTYIYTVGDSETNIWGLSGRERRQRMLKSFARIRLVDCPEQIPVRNCIVLACRSLFDSRVLASLIDAQTNPVLSVDKGQSVGVRIIDVDVYGALADFMDGGKGEILSALPLKSRSLALCLPSRPELRSGISTAWVWCWGG